MTRFALWVLAGDILIAAIMLMVLKELVLVLLTFAIIYVGSFAFLRRHAGPKPRAMQERTRFHRS